MTESKRYVAVNCDVLYEPNENWELKGMKTLTLSDILKAEMPDLRERMAKELYTKQAERNCSKRIIEDVIIAWDGVIEKSIKDYWYSLADSILDIFKKGEKE